MNIDIRANLYINIIFLEIFPSVVIFTLIQLGSAILRCFRTFASEAVRIQTAKSLEMRLDSLTCLGDGGGLIQVTAENSLVAVAVRLCFFFLNGEEGENTSFFEKVLKQNICSIVFMLQNHALVQCVVP